MAEINPYIHFNGNAEVAFNFYKTAFGGEFESLVRYSEFDHPTHPFPEKEKNNIMHIALPIGKGSMLMGSDTPEFMGRQNENENRSKISVQTESKAEADHIFQSLSAGGQVEMPMEDSLWGTYFGMFRDKFGIEWIISFNPKG